MLEEIISNLGDNYNTSDNKVLDNLLKRVTADALFISNRSNTFENVNSLRFEIEECVKTLYLQRGSEDVNSLSQSGISSNYKKAYEELRNNIIKNGKRVIK